MDDRYLLATARYIEMNPVAANLVRNPGEYPWSSVRAHLTGEDDLLTHGPPLLEVVPIGMIFYICHLLMKSICITVMNGQAALWESDSLSINSRPLFHKYCAQKNRIEEEVL